MDSPHASTQDAGTATFPTVRTGDYKVEVSSVGYKSRTETAEVMPGNSAYSVYVYLQQEGAADSANLPPSATTMNPKLQSEIDKAITKMRRQQFDDSRQHFEKAAKMAPGNPDVQYMWGMLEYYQQHFDLARTKFETAVSINPNHERALVTLGEIQLRDKQPAQAVQTFEKAFLVNGADWRMHYLLAFAYADERNFAKAETHAQRAADLGGKDHSPQARVLLGRILSAEGKVSDARSAFNAVIRDFPADPSAKDAKSELVALDRAAESRASDSCSSVTRPRANASAVSASGTASTQCGRRRRLLPLRFVRGLRRTSMQRNMSSLRMCPCSLDTVLQRTQMRMMKQIANFEKFMATEHIEHQDVDAYGNPGGIKVEGLHLSGFYSTTKNRARCCWMKSATAAKISVSFRLRWLPTDSSGSACFSSIPTFKMT